MEQNYTPRRHLTKEEIKGWHIRIRESLEELKKEINANKSIRQV